jgi:hypothetical protein
MSMTVDEFSMSSVAFQASVFHLRTPRETEQWLAKLDGFK